MPKKSKNKTNVKCSFTEFLNDPPVSTALVVFALVALFLAILEFGQTVYGY